jgi:transposase-like protein
MRHCLVLKKLYTLKQKCMVEKDQQQQLIGRFSAKGIYDKRFIVEVLEQIQNGVPRPQICDQYNIKMGTLKSWIEKDRLGIGSENLNRTVSNQVKRSVVRAIENGRLSVREAQIAHGIRSASAIRRWMTQFQQENDELAIVKDSGMKKKKLTQGNSTDNNQDIKALQKALEEAQLKVAALNTLIDVAEEQLKINIRKKPGAKQSND